MREGWSRLWVALYGKRAVHAVTHDGESAPVRAGTEAGGLATSSILIEIAPGATREFTHAPRAEHGERPDEHRGHAAAAGPEGVVVGSGRRPGEFERRTTFRLDQGRVARRLTNRATDWVSVSASWTDLGGMGLHGSVVDHRGRFAGRRAGTEEMDHDGRLARMRSAGRIDRTRTDGVAMGTVRDGMVGFVGWRTKLSPPSAMAEVAAAIDAERPLSVLDIGCGLESPFSELRSEGIKLTGIDISDAVAQTARRSEQFDDFLVGDVTEMALPDADVVAMFDFIEHLDRTAGERLLDHVERSARRYVIVMTPVGFVPQGPEYGNQFQRHRSGWLPSDFIVRGYRVIGLKRLRWMFGYGAQPRLQFRGVHLVNDLLFKLLRVRAKPDRAFHMLAVKDMRGVPARHLSSARPG